MSVYCIGDLHGRYDLFNMLLQKINFDPTNDKLYILGDVIDWNIGGIKILDYIMENQDSCVLILGNHEGHFLYMTKAYDMVMSKPNIKDAMAKVVDVYSDKLFGPILVAFKGEITKRNADIFYTQPIIEEWLMNGSYHVRKRLLEAMVLLVDSLDFDIEVFDSVYWILSNLRSQYDTKPFVQELLLQPLDKYVRIKEFLTNAPEYIEFDYLGKHFSLKHSKGEINPEVYFRTCFPHATTENVTYIFGHNPVPQLYGKVIEMYNGFSFDYRRIFSWIDDNMNRYYWIDLASNPIAALKLDDMSEYYVGVPSVRKNATKWEVPEDHYPEKGQTYMYVEWGDFDNESSYKETIVTLDNGCFDFLISINKKRKIVYYTQIGWLEYHHTFKMEKWYNGQPINEIIEKVRSDFLEQIKKPEHISVYNLLYGIVAKGN